MTPSVAAILDFFTAGPRPLDVVLAHFAHHAGTEAAILRLVDHDPPLLREGRLYNHFEITSAGRARLFQERHQAGRPAAGDKPATPQRTLF